MQHILEANIGMHTGTYRWWAVGVNTGFIDVKLWKADAASRKPGTKPDTTVVPAQKNTPSDTFAAP